MSKIYIFFKTNKLFKMVEIKLSIFQYPLVKATKLYLFEMKNKLFKSFKRTQDILFHMQENVFKRQSTNVLNFTCIIFIAQKSVLRAKGSCTTKSLKTQKMLDKFYIFYIAHQTFTFWKLVSVLFDLFCWRKYSGNCYLVFGWIYLNTILNTRCRVQLIFSKLMFMMNI